MKKTRMNNRMSPSRRDFLKWLGFSGTAAAAGLASTAEVAAEVVEEVVQAIPKPKKPTSENEFHHPQIQFADVDNLDILEGGLKVRFHVLAQHYPVNAEDRIVQGQLLTLNSSGEVTPYTKDDSFVIGIAGDQKDGFFLPIKHGS